MTFQQLVAQELVAARAEHEPVLSLHHYYSVILEELNEFAVEVANKPRYRCKARLLAELVQVAAMCQRCAEDMELLPGEQRTEYKNGQGERAEDV